MKREQRKHTSGVAEAGEYHEDGSTREDPGGRTYYINIPIRPLSGHVSGEHLQRLALYLGFCGVVTGVVGIVAIVLSSVKVLNLLPWLLIVLGAAALLSFIFACGAPGTSALLLVAILHLCVGIWVLLQPLKGSTMVTFILAGWFVAHGIIKLVMAAQVRMMTTWPAVLVSGLASIILAFVITALTPTVGVRLVSLCFGADVLASGLALFLIALMAKLAESERAIPDADLPYATKEPLLGHPHRGHSGAAV